MSLFEKKEYINDLSYAGQTTDILHIQAQVLTLSIPWNIDVVRILHILIIVLVPLKKNHTYFCLTSMMKRAKFRY
jgi:hypothetical protein